MTLTPHSAMNVHKPFKRPLTTCFAKIILTFHPAPKSAQALHKSQNHRFKFPSRLILLQAKGFSLLDLYCLNPPLRPIVNYRKLSEPTGANPAL